MLTPSAQIEQSNKLVVATPTASEMTGLDMQDMVNELIQRMRYDNAQFFIIDFVNIQLISSDCLGSLVTFLRDIEQMHGRIGLANCCPNVAFLFKVTRLDTVFGLYDSVEEAAEDVADG